MIEIPRDEEEGLWAKACSCEMRMTANSSSCFSQGGMQTVVAMTCKNSLGR